MTCFYCWSFVEVCLITLSVPRSWTLLTKQFRMFFFVSFQNRVDIKFHTTWPTVTKCFIFYMEFTTCSKKMLLQSAVLLQYTIKSPLCICVSDGNTKKQPQTPLFSTWATFPQCNALRIIAPCVKNKKTLRIHHSGMEIVRFKHTTLQVRDKNKIKN